MRTVSAEVGSDLWRYLHVGTIGGACFQAIMADGKGRQTLLKNKIEERKTWESSLPCKTVLQRNRGAILEPYAVNIYTLNSKWDIYEVGKVVVINDYIVISPDVMNFNLFDNRCRAGAEVKCYGLDKHNSIIKKGEMPNSNKGQVQGYVGFLKAEIWDYVLYHPQAKIKYGQISVKPDHDYFQELSQKVDRFIEELKTGSDLTGQLTNSIKE